MNRDWMTAIVVLGALVFLAAVVVIGIAAMASVR